eukprot:488186-Rhodomonas_salina.2
MTHLRCALSGTDSGFAAPRTSSTRLLLPTPTSRSKPSIGRLRLPPVNSAISLRAHAMSGTDLSYGSIYLRACYAMSGTEIAYGEYR